MDGHYDEVLVSWQDPKEGMAKIKQENAKHLADGGNLVATISLGKIGCILIYFMQGMAYEAAEPLTENPDEIQVDKGGDATYPPHTK